MIAAAPIGMNHRPWWLSGDIPKSAVIAAYQPKGAVSLAASYVNLANPGTNNANPVVAPALGSDGWSFGAATAEYLNTGIAPTTINTFLFAKFYTNYYAGSNVVALAGSKGPDNTRFYVSPKQVNDRVYGLNTINKVPGSQTSGVMAIANQRGYLNGVLDFSGSFSGNSFPISIGGVNVEGVFTETTRFYGTISALVIGTGDLSDNQVAALSTAMANL